MTKCKETKIKDKLPSLRSGEMGPNWIPQGPCWDPCCSELDLTQKWGWSRLCSNFLAFNCFLWSGIQFNLSTDWTGWYIDLYDQETIARLVLLGYCGLASRLAEKRRNSFFLRLETAVMAGTREYVVYVSNLTELADIPPVYVKQIKC